MTTRGFAVLLAAAMVSMTACTARDKAKSRAGAADTTAAAVVPGDGTPPAPASGSPDSMGVPSILTPEELAKIPAPPLSAQEMAALAPAQLQLKDMGFRITAPPDTAGLKSRGRIQREWAEALLAYEKGQMDSVTAHLARAREHLATAVNADSNWPNRLRNLEAATLYATGSPGDVKAKFGDLANPNASEILDVGLEWVLLHDDLRLGRGKEAVARLRLVQNSQLSVGLEARKLLAQLQPPPVQTTDNP